jgi:hypothetical protein
MLEPLENRALPSTIGPLTATNFDFTPFSDAVATPMAIAQFDTMGGTRTLTSVEIISSIELDTTISGSVTNRGSTPATFTGSVTNASISVTGTGFSAALTATNANLIPEFTINCPGSATTTIGPFSASLAGSSDFTLTSPADLLAFIGGGTLSYTNAADAASSNLVTGGSNATNNTGVTTSGMATVEVIYTFVTNPTLTTTASAAATLGTMTPTLTDSAVLAGGGDTPTGTITFTLSGPGGFSFTHTDTVNGNGTYTASDTLPTSGQVAGTYIWSAHYSGDSNNTSTDDQGGTAEQTVLSPASPNVVTTASPGSVTVGTSGATLSDSAVLSGGFFETGTITFTLSGPGGFSFTHTDTVNGNGTYTASDMLTAGAAAGTYTWSATYNGDGNNLTAQDHSGTAEQTVVTVLAHPSLVTTASSAVTLGTTAQTVSDSAVLSGGSSPGGTITFTLTGPGGFSFTQTDTVNGNGTYTASDVLPTSGTVVGTYAWSASYSGDSTNTSTSDQGGTGEQTVVNKAHPAVVTTASPGSVTLGTSGATLSDSAVLSGGFFETGTITFTLTGPGGFSFTQTDTVSGNGTYTASDALTAGAATGTYTWSATYAGDGNNLTAVDTGGAAEQTAVSTQAPGGASATIGFWASKNGQALIKSASTIGTDLATAYPNLFGIGAAAFNLNGPIAFMNLTGQSASNVAAYFIKIKNVTGPKPYAQLMSNVLAAYFDSKGTPPFGGNLLTNHITLTSSQAAALGLPTSTTVGDYLTQVNALMAGHNGVIPSSLFLVINDVSDLINSSFDI